VEPSHHEHGLADARGDRTADCPFHAFSSRALGAHHGRDERKKPLVPLNIRDEGPFEKALAVPPCFPGAGAGALDRHAPMRAAPSSR
jgi:hypothetical protein